MMSKRGNNGSNEQKLKRIKAESSILENDLQTVSHDILQNDKEII